MYETHFGLRRRPFRATPDTGCYYPAAAHERALGRLQEGLADGEGLVLLTGEPGAGKTLLCHCLLERLGEVTSVFLTHGRFAGRTGLLQSILYDLSLPHRAWGEQELRLALTDFLLANYAKGKTTVLLVDEAHHLEPDLLEELRLLGNLESRSGKAVQVVLAAQPSLLGTVGRLELASLSQRLAVRAVVEPMTLAEAADYVLHQLRLAGVAPEDVITPEALELLARGARGIPRLLNQAAHQALGLAAEAGTRPADAEAAVEALALLGLEVPEDGAGIEGIGGPAEDNGAPPEVDHSEWRLTAPRPA
jgi:type II secretory pathway predicted ATPase ExeA